MPEDLDGVLPVDKPRGPTSHDVVAIARRALHMKRIGHTGTLDPFASGLLLLCLGKTTRLAEYLTGLSKRYIATARLGIATNTDDNEGEPISTSDAWRSLSVDDVTRALLQMTGAVQQVPPAFSAKKIEGERMYVRARRGETVEQPPVEVTIHEMRVIDVALPDVTFEVRCSSGTYVRAIARDLGAALGVGAHLTELRRTAVGDFSIADALTLDDLSDAERVRSALLPQLHAVRHLPHYVLGQSDAAAIGHGRAITAPPDVVQDTPIVLTHADRLLAIASREDGVLRPGKVFSDA